MGFQGSLKTIKIPELFFLLSHLRQTGVLTLASERDELSFIFYRGNLVFANCRDSSRRLGSYLLRLGFLTQTELRSPLNKCPPGELYFGQKLLKSGRVEEQHVRVAVQEQMLDLLGEVLAWTTGAFHFDEDELPFAIPSGDPASTQSVILEATRRWDERNFARQSFPDFSVVFKLGETEWNPPPSPEESQVIDLIDGQRTVEQVLFESPLGWHTTADILRSLVSRQLVRESSAAAELGSLPKTPSLHMLPTAASTPARLFSVFNSDGNQLPQLAEILAEDPMLAAKVLQILRSSGAEVPRQKLGLQSLAGLLGVKRLKAILLPEAIRGVFFTTPTVFWKECWDHANLCAQLSRSIAGHIEYAFGDEAYLAGLLHNLGAFIFLGHDPIRYRQLARDSEKREEDMETLEEQAFGTTHSKLGGVFAEKWNFPSSIVNVIKAHHKVETSSLSPLSNIVCAANGLAAELGLRLGHHPAAPGQYKSALKRLNIRPKQAASLLHGIPCPVASLTT